VVVGLALLGYFIKGLIRQFDKMEAAQERHEALDETRFTDMRNLIQHNEEVAMTIRHNFRNEIMGFVGEQVRELKRDLVERFRN
jgi:phage regulator Rha-like protein